MKIEKLPKEMQESINDLKYGSNTIECDVKDALEDAKNIKEFRQLVTNKMLVLIGEAKEVIDKLV